MERYILRVGNGAGSLDHELIMDLHQDQPWITEWRKWTGKAPTPTTEDLENGWSWEPPVYPPPVTWKFATYLDAFRWMGHELGLRPEYMVYGPERVLPTNWEEHMPSSPPDPDPEPEPEPEA